MVHSMTGFASQSGAAPGVSWAIELRGVNAKGLDIRVRAPERMTGFDQTIKAMCQKALTRGSIQVSVRVERDVAAAGMAVDIAGVDALIEAAKTVQARADAAGLSLRAASVAELLALRGVLGSGDEADVMPASEAVQDTAQAALAAFLKMRAREGAALLGVLTSALDEIETLTRTAATLADARKDDVAKTLKANLARVLDSTDGADPDRVAQELALLAVKADVTEEIDRLHAHVGAARELLGAGGAVGRKLDFLMQEFNREANTLCSKSGDTELTRVGLDLKALIDQMREQVQNVE
jgi:uncharacterized protein (TIGR00255 family)